MNSYNSAYDMSYGKGSDLTLGTAATTYIQV